MYSPSSDFSFPQPSTSSSQSSSKHPEHPPVQVRQSGQLARAEVEGVERETPPRRMMIPEIRLIANRFISYLAAIVTRTSILYVTTACIFLFNIFLAKFFSFFFKIPKRRRRAPFMPPEGFREPARIFVADRERNSSNRHVFPLQQTFCEP